MAFYSFTNGVQSWGSFETLYFAQTDPQWFDPTTYMGDMLLYQFGYDPEVDDEETMHGFMRELAEGHEPSVYQEFDAVQKQFWEEAQGHIQNMTGWYWQAAFPGCLPDGDPVGPFTSEIEAIADAWDMPVNEAWVLLHDTVEDADNFYFKEHEETLKLTYKALKRYGCGMKTATCPDIIAESEMKSSNPDIHSRWECALCTLMFRNEECPKDGYICPCAFYDEKTIFRRLEEVLSEIG